MSLPLPEKGYLRGVIAMMCSLLVTTTPCVLAGEITGLPLAADASSPGNGTDIPSLAGAAQTSSQPPRPPLPDNPDRLSALMPGITTRANDVVTDALNLIGVRYRWGGNTPDSGLDCSGFVRYVFKDVLNVTLPRRAEDMSRVGQYIHLDDLKPGDLVFFNTVRRAVSHVGIYIGGKQFVHSPSTGSTIRVNNLDDSYWATHFAGARRISIPELAVQVQPRRVSVATEVEFVEDNTTQMPSAGKDAY